MTKRDPKVRRLVSMSAAFAAAAITAGFTHSATAATLDWDPAMNGSLSGGVGTWDLNTTPNWWNAALTPASDVMWSDVSALGTDTAVFNNAGGLVTIDNSLGAFSALGLQFSGTGYTLSGSGTLTLGSGGINAGTLTSGVTTINVTGGLSLQGGGSWSLGSGATLTTLGTASTVFRNVGSTINFSSTGTFNGAGILDAVGNTVDGWATIGANGGTDWAVSSGGKIAAVASYINDTWATGDDTTVTKSSTITNKTTNSLRFDSSTAAYTLTLSGTDTITSGGILVTSNVGSNLSSISGGTIEGASGADLVIIQNNANAGGGLTINSLIADNSGSSLTKSGAGLLTVSGSSAYTGPTTVNGGNLTFSNMTPNLSPAMTISAGATLEFDITTAKHTMDGATRALSSNVALGGQTITGSGTFYKFGTGVLGLDGTMGGGVVSFNMTGGTIEVNQGTLRNANYTGSGGGSWLGNLSSLQIDSGATFDMGDAVSSPVYIDSLNGSGTFTNKFPGTTGQPAGYDGVFSLYLGHNSNVGVGGGSFSGTLQDNFNNEADNSAALAVFKEGTGTQTLDGTSGGITYSGGTEVDGGTLILKNTVTGSGTFNVFNGTLQFDVSTGTTLGLSPGTAVGDLGTITDNSATPGPGNLIKSSGGTLVLGGGTSTLPEIVSLTGLIDVQGGTLQTMDAISATWAGNLAALQIESGAFFDTGNADVWVDYLAGAGTIQKTMGGTNIHGANTLTIGVNNNNSGTLAGGTAIFSGIITNSVGDTLNLVKEGTGMQILSGTNTYTGTTMISGVDPTTGLYGGGVLSTGTTGILANGLAASSIGASSNAASNLIIDGGTLQYANTTLTSAQSTDRLFTVTSNGATLDASGAYPIIFTNPGAIVFKNYPSPPATLPFTLTGTGVGVLYPIISDNGSSQPTTVTVTGISGSWSLPAANTYTGVTTISAGLLSDNVTLGSEILSTGASGILGIEGSTGGVPSSIGASSNAAANLVIDGGTLQYANTVLATPQSTDRLFTVTPFGATLDASGTAPITFTGNTNSEPNSIAYSVSDNPESLTFTGSKVGVFNPIISDNDSVPGNGLGPTSVFKTGSGTWTLNAVNTYTGGTTISAGTLILGNVAALGDPSGILTVTGGTLDLHGLSPFVNGLSDSVYDPVAMGYGPSSSAGFITSNNGASTLNITTNTNLNVNLGLGLTYSGTISGPITVAVGGSGFQYLAGNNSYTGGTVVNDTANLVGSTGSFGSGNLTVAAGAAASSTGSIASTAVVTVNTDGVNPGFVYFNDANPVIASLTGGGTVQLNAGVLPSLTTLTINNGNIPFGSVSSFSGIITDANDQNGNGLGAIKLTGGTLILSGSNSYSGGTTITGIGTTLLAMTPASVTLPASATGSGSVLVQSGGRLGGTGVILNTTGSPVTITTGGIISPGPDAANTTVGTLTTGDMTWDNGQYIFKTTSASAASTLASTLATGTTQDFLVVTGTLNIDTLDHGKFTINITDSGQLATPFIIANAVGVDENGTPVDPGDLSNIPYDLTNDFIVQDNGLTNGNYLVTVVADQSASDANFGKYDIQISESVPEPGSLALLGLASLGLLRRRRANPCPDCV